LGGGIDGGAGRNTLDYSLYTTARQLVLSGLYADGAEGTESGTLGGGFARIHLIIGGSALDTLTTLDSDSTFVIDGDNAGKYSTGGYTLEFVSLDHLVGGSGNDSFCFSGTGTIAGSINAGGGRDILDYSAYAAGVAVNLFTGSATGVNGGAAGSIAGFEDLTGSLFDDELTGDNNANTITGLAGDDILTGLDGDDIYVFADGWGNDTVVEAAAGGNDTLDFTAVTVGLFLNLAADYNIGGDGNSVTQPGGQVENILSGSGDDIFIISGNAGLDLYGGAGNDTFRLLNGADFSGILDGQEGLDILDYQDYSSGVQVNLNGASVTWAGQAYLAQSATAVNGGVAYGFQSIEGVIGSLGDDILIGSDSANTFEGLAGDDVLIGLGGDDLYCFGDNWGNDIIIETAGGGNDTISFAAASSGLTFGWEAMTASTFRLLVTVTGDPDGVNRLTHEGIQVETLVGGSGNDTFAITGDQRLNLIGGAGNDVFIFQGNAGLDGYIDGGTGSDALDFSGSSTARNISLTGVGANGFSGQQATITGGFANIDILVGSAADNDTLTGMDEDSVYTLGDGDNNTLLVSGFTLAFSGYEYLVGGSANDTFRLVGNASVSGGIDGGAGIDTLDYSGYDKGDGSGVTVNLLNGAATAIAGGKDGGILRLENLIGSQFNDILTGDNNANIIRGGSGDDMISGLGGDDTLDGGLGNDTLDGGTGSDTVDYSGNTSAGIEISLALGLAVSAESGTDTLVAVENVIGTDFNDVITGDDNANRLEGRGGDDEINGLGGNDTIIGGAGNDTFAFSGSGSIRVTLTAGPAAIPLITAVTPPVASPVLKTGFLLKSRHITATASIFRRRRRRRGTFAGTKQHAD